MGFRFFRRFKIAPGMTLNMSKSGPSLSFGPRGFKYTLGPKGTRKTFGIPGTGLYYTITSGWGKEQSSPARAAPASAPPSLSLGFFSKIFIPSEDRKMVAGLKQFLSGNIDEAYLTFRSNPEFVDSVFMTGFLSLGRNLFQEAEAAFLKCQRAVSDLGKGIQKYLSGFRLSLQITEYIDALIDVDARGLLLALTEARQKQGKFEEASRDVASILNNDSNDMVICLSWCEMIVTSPAATESDLYDLLQRTSAIKNEAPIYTNLLYLRGAAMYRLQLADAAIQQLSVALRKKINRPDALLQQIRYLRGRIYEQQGQRKRARKDYELVFAENPLFKDVAQRLGP